MEDNTATVTRVIVRRRRIIGFERAETGHLRTVHGTERQLEVRAPDGHITLHGAGCAGEPLRPYLGWRAPHNNAACDYRVTLPDKCPEVVVYARPHSRAARGSWADVEAPDVSYGEDK